MYMHLKTKLDLDLVSRVDLAYKTRIDTQKQA